MTTPAKTTTEETERPPMRRVPRQQRSRERVDRLLAAAEGLIAETGADALKMNAVAERAGVPIGSLYQYFPDKSALMHALADRSFAECRRCIEEALAPVRTPEELAAAFDDLIEEYYAIFRAEPVIRDIRSGALADKALQALEREDGRRTGALLADALARVKPAADRETLFVAAYLIMQFGETTMRLALAEDRATADALVAAYKRMALAEIARL
ncbi:MAG: TetR family transcriptional regulator [Alphaproteobacteria bacterium]|nr:TetR family transcriptional regulator [Alphaproteobacteria bacterium]